MRKERAKQLREMVHLVPELVKASLVNQALEISRIVTATFEFSDGFKKVMRNVPPNYIEKIKEVYSNLSYKAFEDGMAQAKVKKEHIRHLAPLAKKDPEECLKELKSLLPLPYSLAQGLRGEFEKEVQGLISTVPDAVEIYKQFLEDMEYAFFEGVKEYMSEAAEQHQSPDPVIVEVQPVEVSASLSKSEIIKKLEEYTKLLKDPEAERVLRATLGLSAPAAPSAPSGQMVEASSESDAILVTIAKELKAAAEKKNMSIPELLQCDEFAHFKSLEKEILEESAKAEEMVEPKPAEGDAQIGPFVPEQVKKMIYTAIKTHNYSEDDPQCVVLEVLVPGYAKEDPELAAKTLVKKLSLESLVSGVYTKSTVEEVADILAETLTEALGLPGSVLLFEHNDDFVLAFCFEKKDQEELGKMALTSVYASEKVVAAKKMKSGLPAGPQGALSLQDQKEVANLNDHKPGSLTLKELKKLAPRSFDYLNSKLIQARKGEFRLKEIGRFFSGDLDGLVEQVYGQDGLSFLGYLKAKH